MSLPCFSAENKREEMVQKVVTSDDVQFYWLITTADFEIDESGVHTYSTT